MYSSLDIMQASIFAFLYFTLLVGATGPPTHLPTFSAPSINSSTPSPAPTSVYSCPYYSTSNTNSAQQNYDTCTFTACGGSTITANGCGCSGDQYLILYSGSVEVAYDDDSSSCGTCSVLSYTVPGSSSECSTFILNEGCYSSGSCSGTVAVSGINSNLSTSYPVVGPYSSLTCSAYSAVNTYSATQDTAQCYFSACGGTTVDISGCGCSGDQYLNIYQGTALLYSADDSSTCGACSTISFTVSGSPSTCYDYTIQEGCFSSSSCSGTVTVSGSLADPVVTPTAHPTVYPTSSTIYCPSYSASGTNSAQQNYDTCSFVACGGDLLTISGCGCSGDQYLALSYGNSIVAYSDDSCGACSYFSYTVPGYSFDCYSYTLQEGCYDTSSCSGTVTVTGASYAVVNDDNSNDDNNDSKSFMGGIPSILMTGIIIPVAVLSAVILIAFLVYLLYASRTTSSALTYVPSQHEIELAVA